MARKQYGRMLFLACLIVGGLAVKADDRNPNTAWMSAAKVGVFIHYLPHAGNFKDVENFDVDGLVKQLVALRVRYFCLTLGQNSGYMCSPNAAYEQIAGYAPFARCSQRDLPLELARALAPHKIRLMLYLPCQTPNSDLQAARAFGIDDGNAKPHDRKVNVAFARMWARVIEEWSVRYGDQVAGWWFDGGYAWCGITDEVCAIYAAAVKKGNPQAIVSFNPGVSLKRAYRADDYTAGELNEPLKEVCAERFLDNAQWHVLTYIGSTWGRKDTRYTDQQWIDWVQAVTAKGGAVTFDVGIHPTGVLIDAQMKQLQAITQAVR